MTFILAPFVGLFILWLMFRLATYALPFACGLWSAFWLLHHDNGFLISIIAGFGVAIVVLATGQILFSIIRTPALRFVLAAMFALPAGVAGYNLAHSLGQFASGPGTGLTVLSWVVGIIIAYVASIRLANPVLMTGASSASVGGETGSAGNAGT